MKLLVSELSLLCKFNLYNCWAVFSVSSTLPTVANVLNSLRGVPFTPVFVTTPFVSCLSPGKERRPQKTGINLHTIHPVCCSPSFLAFISFSPAHSSIVSLSFAPLVHNLHNKSTHQHIQQPVVGGSEQHGKVAWCCWGEVVSFSPDALWVAVDSIAHYFYRSSNGAVAAAAAAKTQKLCCKHTFVRETTIASRSRFLPERSVECNESAYQARQHSVTALCHTHAHTQRK